MLELDKPANEHRKVLWMNSAIIVRPSIQEKFCFKVISEVFGHMQVSIIEKLPTSVPNNLISKCLLDFPAVCSYLLHASIVLTITNVWELYLHMLLLTWVLLEKIRSGFLVLRTYCMAWQYQVSQHLSNKPKVSNWQCYIQENIQ